MNGAGVAVFFYGLFMDDSLLAAKGIHSSRSSRGRVDGYRLHIGQRATLVPEPAGQVYGLLMVIGSEDVAALYADESVADYVAELVSVNLPDGTSESAVCYNLPQSQLEGGTNSEYASALLLLARRLGFPTDYLHRIAEAVHEE